MNCDVYLRKGILYLPTLGKMGEGFYRGVEPVAVCSLSDTAQIRQALQTTISRGNPIVPMLPRREIPPPVLLKYAGVKKWSEFERGMRFWNVKDSDGIFQISREAKQPEGFWKPDPKQTIRFPPGVSADDVIDRMIMLLQEAAGRAT
jgi:hypothetical protein